jgi:acyl-CoA synthetase (AMP-forming)/AMP-acid ligase II
MRFRTLNDLLRQRAGETPERIAYTFLPEGEDTEQEITYEQLDRRARAIAAYLQSCAQPGARVLLLFPPGLDYIVALFGCFYSGMIAVPAYPPKLTRSARGSGRIQSIIEDAQPSMILSLAAAAERSRASITPGRPAAGQ